MNKYKTLVILAFGLCLAGCEEESSSGGGGSTPIDPAQFDELCKNSGGEVNNGICVCSGKNCKDGDLCNTVTKECPKSPIPPDQFNTACTESGGTPDGSACICSGERCATWEICVDNKCPVIPPPDFSQMCTYSGGKMSGNVCSCDNGDCEVGELCNTKTKQCIVPTPPPDQVEAKCIESGGIFVNNKCECGGVPCEDNKVCVDNKCPDPSLPPDFSQMCSYSGGTMSGNVCSCDNGDCEAGALCNMISGQCDPDEEPTTNCNGFERSCKNNSMGIGIVSDCVNGVQFERSCNTVSCNEDNTDCGECWNEEIICKNGADRIGTIKSCVNGKKQEQSCENVSCDSEYKKCGTCLNYERTCVDEEVKVTVKDKDGNDVEAYKEIGRIYQCEDGQKGKLVLDCQNTSCYSFRAIDYDEKGNPFFVKDEAKTASEGYDVWKKAPADKVACGECINFDKKCENDLSDFAHMYRCQLGQWAEIKSTSDPAAFKPETTRITLTGYYPITQKVQSFETQVGAHDANWNFGVSCNADYTDWGVCHNSVQICVNQERGERGYIVKCERGALVDYDNTGDNIACTCKESGNNRGGCSSGRNCYAAQTYATGEKICEPPGADAWNPKDPDDPND